MFFKTLAFIVLLYFLVKFISRLFLPPANRKPSSARIFYQVFKNIREQKKQQDQQQRNKANPKNRFDEIEEAEYEEIPEKKADSSDRWSHLFFQFAYPSISLTVIVEYLPKAPLGLSARKAGWEFNLK